MRRLQMWFISGCKHTNTRLATIGDKTIKVYKYYD